MPSFRPKSTPKLSRRPSRARVLLPATLLAAGLVGCANKVHLPPGGPRRRLVEEQVVTRTRRFVAGSFHINPSTIVVPKSAVFRSGGATDALSESNLAEGIANNSSFTATSVPAGAVAIEIGDNDGEILLAQAPPEDTESDEDQQNQRDTRTDGNTRPTPPRKPRSTRPQTRPRTPDNGLLPGSTRYLFAFVILVWLSLTAYGHYVVEPRNKRKREEEWATREVEQAAERERIRRQLDDDIRARFTEAGLDYDSYPTADQEAEANRRAEQERLREWKNKRDR